MIWTCEVKAMIWILRVKNAWGQSHGEIVAGFPPEKWLGLLTAWQQASKRERPTCESGSFRCLKTQPQELHGDTSTTFYGSKEFTKPLFPHRTPKHFLTQKVCRVFPSYDPPPQLLLSLPSAVRFQSVLPGVITSHCEKSLSPGSLFCLQPGSYPLPPPLLTCLLKLIIV